MSDFRRANFLPMTLDFKRLDYFRALYVDIAFALPTTKTFFITNAWEANLPGLAFNLYNDINYWWVLGLYNGIVDPILDVSVGKQMKAFNKEDAIAYMSAKQDSSLQSGASVVIV